MGKKQGEFTFLKWAATVSLNQPRLGGDTFLSGGPFQFQFGMVMGKNENIMLSDLEMVLGMSCCSNI